MSISFHTVNRFVLPALLITIGVILTDTLINWEYIFRYYNFGGWTTSRVLARFVPAFLFVEAALVLTNRAKLWSTIALLGIPVIFGFLLVIHPSDKVMHFEAEAFGSNTIFLVAILICGGLSVLQSRKKTRKSRLMDILAVVGIAAGFAVVGIVQPIFPEEYDNMTESLPANHFDSLMPLEDDTKVFAMFGSGCIHCARASQKLFLIHEEAGKLDQLQFFFPGKDEHAQKFFDYTNARADYSIIDGKLFGDLNGPYIPGIYMRTDSNTFAAWRGGAFNMKAIELIEEAISK